MTSGLVAFEIDPATAAALDEIAGLHGLTPPAAALGMVKGWLRLAGVLPPIEQGQVAQQDKTCEATQK
jgi:hypothetical protein